MKVSSFLKFIACSVLLTTAVSYAGPQLPKLHRSHNTPKDLLPVSVDHRPYKVTIDYPHATDRRELQHTYLRIIGAGPDQTLLYFNLESLFQWEGEGDHLTNLGARKRIAKRKLQNGYRVTYEFSLKDTWPSASDVDIEAWSVARDGTYSPTLRIDWNRTFNSYTDGPQLPRFRRSRGTPQDLLPASVDNGVYKVTIDYPHTTDRSELLHTYLRIVGAGEEQTLMYYHLESLVQWQGEGDHLTNLSVRKRKKGVRNGYRVIYKFSIKDTWPSATDVDIEAWSISKDGTVSPVLRLDWNRTFNNGLKIVDAGLDGLVDNDGDGWYSSIEVAALPKTFLPFKAADLTLSARSSALTLETGEEIAAIEDFITYNESGSWARTTVTTDILDAYDFRWQAYDNGILYHELAHGMDADITQVRLEPASDDVYREVSFAGMEWVVRAAKDQGPGPFGTYNDWLNNPDAVWVDSEGLHLTIGSDSAGWYCTEVYTKDTVGYGTYTFKIDGRIDRLDPNAVFGLFIYENDAQEADFEFSLWGDPTDNNAQFVVQPYTNAGNLERFNIVQEGNYTLHVMIWEPHQITYKSYHGHHVNPENLIHEWVYRGNDIPTADNEKLHMNLWLMDTAPAHEQPMHFIIKDVTYTPL